MKSNVSVLRGLKHEHVTDFGGRDRLLSSLIIYEFLIKYRHIGKRENSGDEVEPDAFAAVKFKNGGVRRGRSR